MNFAADLQVLLCSGDEWSKKIGNETMFSDCELEIGENISSLIGWKFHLKIGCVFGFHHFGASSILICMLLQLAIPCNNEHKNCLRSFSEFLLAIDKNEAPNFRLKCVTVYRLLQKNTFHKNANFLSSKRE